ncbi:MAG: HD domain-containing protein [Solirubrobacteraceae bacterium]
MPPAPDTAVDGVDALREHLRDATRRMGLDEVYEVGGCLRDELLGRVPSDIDLAVVGVTADELLARARKEGRAQRLVVADRLIGVRLRTAWTPPEGVEIALARTEVSTGPGHTDFAIRASPDVTIEEDLRRRDFTINALARHLHDGHWVDVADGRGDLERRVLRTLGPRTLAEDPLRVLRGLARVAHDDLQIAPATWEAMREHAVAFRPDDPDDTDRWPLSPERILTEYEKTLMGAEAHRALHYARDLGILTGTIPEWTATVGYEQESRHHALPLDEHLLLALRRAVEAGASPDVRWAALLHDIGKPTAAWRGDDGRRRYSPDTTRGRPGHAALGGRMAMAALRRLRAPRRRIDTVGALVADHMYRDDEGFADRGPAEQGPIARRFIHRIGRDRIAAQLLLRRCDRAGKRPDGPPPGWDRDLAAFEAAIARERTAPITVGELAIGGAELLELGLRGPRVGQVQRALLERVLDDPDANEPDRLTAWARELA